MRERAVNRNRDNSPMYQSGYGEWVANTDVSRGIRSTALLEFGSSFRQVRDDGFANRYQYNPNQVRPLEQFRGDGLRAGGYVQASITRFNGRLTLSAGGRADGHTDSEVRAASPYASIAWQALPATRVSLAWSEAIQYPEIAQLYSLYAPGPLLPIEEKPGSASQNIFP